MKEFSFKKIDAFATSNSGGNPAGYVLVNAAITRIEGKYQLH